MKQTNLDQIMNRIKQYEAQKHFVLAAELAEEYDLLEEAVRLYLKQGNSCSYNAAVLEKKLGHLENSNKLYDQAIEFFENDGIYYTAVGIAREKGDLQKEAALREKYHLDPNYP